MNKAELNNIKSTLSVAYVQAIAAKLNFAFHESNRQVDGIGLDCEIFNRGIGTPRSNSTSNEIKVQIKSFSKSSKSMYRHLPKELQYKLTDILTPIGAAFYLIVVELPEEEKFDEWLKVTPDELTIKKCAYFIRVTDVKKPGFITIPKSNLLTSKSLPQLFLTSQNKEQLI